MSAGWVAAGVRAKGLVRRRLGPRAAVDLAASSSLDAAVEKLAGTPYSSEVKAGSDLTSAGHGVWAVALWHTRVLAGWCPPLGAGALRMLSAGFEIANVGAHLRRLEGAPEFEPFTLGSMATAWTTVSKATTPGDVRAALASSAWGDPGGEDWATVRLSLMFGWARRVLDSAPGGADWAVSGAGLLIARVLAEGALGALGLSARRDADHVLLPHWQRASTLEELAPLVPKAAQEILAGATSDEDLWRAEARWWSMLESTGGALTGRSAVDAYPVVGAVGMLLADAWRTRAALELAARGGGDLRELLDAVA